MVDHGFGTAPLFPKFDIPLHIKCKANAFTIDTSHGPLPTSKIQNKLLGIREAIWKPYSLRTI